MSQFRAWWRIVAGSMLVVGLTTGCTSALPFQVDESFRKKVAADPFPTAAQQGIYSSTNP